MQASTKVRTNSGGESTRFVCLLFIGAVWLALGCSCLAAEPAVPNSRSRAIDQPPQVYLEYRELASAVLNRYSLATVQFTPFKKEPALDPRKTVRGALSFGGESQHIPFAWDYARGKLYLDLNRNGDLTDDPTGVFSAAMPQPTGGAQSFTNVHLAFPTPSGLHPMLVDLTLYRFGRNVNCYVGLRSFWQTKVALADRECQLGVVEDIDRKFGTLV